MLQKITLMYKKILLGILAIIIFKKAEENINLYVNIKRMDILFNWMNIEWFY